MPPPPPPPFASNSSPTNDLLSARSSLKPSSSRSVSPARGSASSTLAGEALLGFNLSSSTLSFLTPGKAAQYKEAFDDAGPVLPRFASERGFLQHEKALVEFRKTGCPDETVQMIWAICNVSPSPGYTLPEFCLAMSLCERAAADPDHALPDLDDAVIKEVQIASGYVAPDKKPSPSTSSGGSSRPVVRPEPGASNPMRTTVDTGRAKDAENPFRAMMASDSVPSPPVVEERGPVSAETLRKADDLFGAMAGADGMMDGTTVKDILTQYSLPDASLASAWDLCSRTVPGKLTRGEFRGIVWLVDEFALNGREWPGGDVVAGVLAGL